jgi:hypothetical protein
MRYSIILFFLLLSTTTHAQLKGIVLNKETRESIPFANISIENTIFGTTANTDGCFQFKEIPAEKRLVVSSVGFETQYVSVSDSVVEIFLQPKIYEIGIVTVKPTKNPIKTHVNEITTRNCSNFFVCNGYPWISARYFEYKSDYKSCPLIKEIKVLTQSERENSKFNIRILSADSKGEPSEELIGENIIATTKKGNQIFTVDLSNLNLLFPENGLFIALEWLIIEENKYSFIYKMKGEKEKRYEIRYNPKFAAFPKKGRILTWSYSGGKWQQKSYANHKETGEFLDLAIEISLSE